MPPKSTAMTKPPMKFHIERSTAHKSSKGHIHTAARGASALHLADLSQLLLHPAKHVAQLLSHLQGHQLGQESGGPPASQLGHHVIWTHLLSRPLGQLALGAQYAV
jgi:hypothetical protein